MAKKPAMAPIFGTAKAVPKLPEVAVEAKPDYDVLISRGLKDCSDSVLRFTITWADYRYWVKQDPMVSDVTFDLMVREYQSRRPDDVDFLDKIGMW